MQQCCTATMQLQCTTMHSKQSISLVFQVSIASLTRDNEQLSLLFVLQDSAINYMSCVHPDCCLYTTAFSSSCCCFRT